MRTVKVSPRYPEKKAWPPTRDNLAKAKGG